MPPLDSGIASVLGRTLPSRPAYALEFSTASFFKYPVRPDPLSMSLPASSPASSIASFSATVVLFRLPFGLPFVLRCGNLFSLFFNAARLLLFLCLPVLLKALPCLSNLPSGSRLISDFFSSVSIGSVSPTTSSVAPPLIGSDRVYGLGGALCLTALRGAYRRVTQSRICATVYSPAQRSQWALRPLLPSEVGMTLSSRIRCLLHRHNRITERVPSEDFTHQTTASAFVCRRDACN